jgi:peptide/nickel transport system permease protein
MVQYSLRRIAASIPALVAVVIVVFAILRLIPGDPARFIGGENMGAEQIAVLRHKLGLDQPLPTQFWNYIDGLAHLNLGKSLTTQLPVASLIGHALSYTVVLAFASVVIAILISVPLGVLAAFAKFRGKERTDGAIMSVVMVMNNVPSFYLSLLLIMLFTVYLGIFPLSGDLHWNHPGALLMRLVMPVLGLAIGGRDARPGLHPHGPVARYLRAHHPLQARVAQRQPSDHHHDRAVARPPDRRHHHRGVDLLDTGHRHPAHHGDHEP